MPPPAPERPRDALAGAASNPTPASGRARRRARLTPPVPRALARAGTRARQQQRQQWALGLLGTLAVVLLWAAGLLDFLEQPTLDLRAQAFDAGSPGPSPAVVLLALDDKTFDILGRWPWPARGERLGAVVRELTHAGAKVVAMDITYQYEAPDDSVFAEAIKAHGNVVLATAFPVRAERTPRLLEDLRREPALRDLPQEEAVRVLVRRYFKDRLSPYVTRGPEFDEVRREWQQATTMLKVASRSSFPVPADAIAWPTSEAPIPPVPLLAGAAADLANVTFETYDLDFTVRRVPILMEHEGRLWPSLGLSAALHYLGVPPSSLRIEDGHLVIPVKGEAPRRLPLTPGRIAAQRAQGLFYLAWPRGSRSSILDASKRPWQWQFYNTQDRTEGEFPLWRAYDPYDLQLKISENLASLDKLAGVFTRAQMWSEEESARYRALRARLFKADPTTPAWNSALDRACLGDLLHLAPEDPAFPPLLGDLRTLAEKGAREAAGMRDFLKPENGDLGTLSPEERANYDQYAAAAETTPGVLKTIDEGLANIAVVRAELAKRLGGKIVLVGWTATGIAADFVGTSIDPRTPGPHLHAAVASSVLTAFARTFAPWWADLVAIITLGTLGTLLGVRATVITAPLATIGLCVVWFLLAGAVLWDYQWLIVAVAAPVAAAVVGTGLVMLHRLISEQRARRKTEERFKSYLAPAVVDILVNNPHLDSMKPATRELSIMFTDLAGFTTTAEKLGGERTAAVLAKFLGSMTEIVQGTGATLDKYIGDAIMAFWGAPIEDPQHARHACQAASAMIIALDEMNARGDFGDAGPLVMRVGIATGEIMVGDFGNPPRNSSYTVIGDTANLASRLEGANKAFGSRVLVNQATKDRAGEGFVFRLVGFVRVKGRAGAEGLYELLVPSGPRKDRLSDWATTSDKAVAAFRSARFQECVACFEALRRDFDDHGLAEVYLEEVAALQARAAGGPLPGDFDGTITLTEK